MKTLNVRADQGLCHSPYFTHGKVYVARQVGDLNVFEVTDDIGHTRIIIPDDPCPHFVMPFITMNNSDRGRFLTVREE